MIALTAGRNDEGRPLAEERPRNVSASDIHIVGQNPDPERERCRLCGHRIYSRESIEAGIGRDCRRRLRAALRTAEPDVLAAYAIALGAA